MSRKKSTMIAIGIVLVVIAAGIVLLLQNLDALVAAAIEKYGSEAAGTKVRVDAVRISLKEGRGTVIGLSVANPPGYSQEPIFTLGEMTLDLDTGTLSTDLPVVEEIRIGESRFRYEIDEQGKSNLDVLKKNLQSPSPSKSPEETRGNGGEQKLRIDRLTMAEGTVTLDLTRLGGKSVQAKLPGMTLKGLGGKEGITPKNLANVVLTALLKNLEKAAARQGAGQLLRDQLGGKATELEKQIDKKLGAGAGEQLKNLLGQ